MVPVNVAPRLVEPVSDPDIVGRAESLIPVLRARGDATADLARLPEETVADLAAAGMFDLMRPRAHGGLQTDLMTYMDAMVALGRGDPSAAWATTLININAWFLSVLYPADVVAEVFAAPDARIAAVLQPRKCKTRRVEGGIVIEEGMWAFNSGVYHCQWDMLGVPVPDADGNHLYDGLALMPISDVQLLNDWNTIGIRGSGSTSVAVRDVFVPDARLSRMDHARDGIRPANELDQEWLYRVAFTGIGQIVIAFPALGVGQGALDIFMEQLAKRGITGTQYAKQSEAPITHLRLGEASVKIDAARTIIAAAAAQLEREARAGRMLPPIARGRIRRDTGFADRLIWEAVDLLADASGGSFAAASHPLSRAWHDARVASLHATVLPSTVYELYGRMLCGLEPPVNV